LAKIVTVEQMRAIEKAADASGLTYDLMMENAGRAIAEAVQDQWPYLTGMKVLILVGTGNNGGDGLVAGHYLAQEGSKVKAYLTRERSEEDMNFARLSESASQITGLEQDSDFEELREMVREADMVIDAVLGTGFQLPIKGAAKAVLEAVKDELSHRDAAPLIVAVDCPSGLDCDSGEMAQETLVCDLTVTLAAAKPGLLTFPGAETVGKLVVADIGINPDQDEMAAVALEITTANSVKGLLPPRPRDAHKGTFGRALIVAGSINYPGAAVLAGLGAYRVGAGLVTLAVPGAIQSMLVSQLPEATWVVLPHEMGVIAEGSAAILMQEIAATQAMLLGPGFGQDQATEAFLERFLTDAGGVSRGAMGFLQSEKRSREPIALPPCVIDADGLKLLKRIPNWPDLLPKPSVLTPHPGEMSVMTDVPKDEIQADRVKSAIHWAERWGHVVVLKGAFTVIAAPDGRISVLPFATPALARAGTGDVLAGAIVGFEAQGLPAYEAAVLGAFVHGWAGELAAETLGTTSSVLAGEISESMIEVMAELTRS
jgi:NAD(P)H-hydrate epimerase